MLLKLIAAMLCCQFSVEVKPSFTIDVEKPRDIVAIQPNQPRQVFLAMWTATYCGPCRVWKNNTKRQVEGLGYYVKEYEMTDPAIQAKYGGRVSRVPSFAVIDSNTGEWLSELKEGSIDLATAKWMLDGSTSMTSEQVVSLSPRTPPVRFIQWPGWGQIDLETYNRNCNCGMCISIRAKQAEYRQQLEAFQRPQTQVTPDQEGTPDALVETMLDQMDLRSEDVLAELGCGDGRILLAAARRGIRGIGVEIDPVRADVARNAVKAAGLDNLVTIETGDALEFDLSRATAATAFLYPPLLAKLSPRLTSLRVVASPYHEIPGLPMKKIGDVWIYRQ